MSFKVTDKEHVIYSKSDNTETIIDDEDMKTDEDIKTKI